MTLDVEPGFTVREVRHSHKCRRCGKVWSHRPTPIPMNNHACPNCGTVNLQKHEQVLRYEKIRARKKKVR